MLQDVPYIADPIGDMQDLAMSMYRSEYSRYRLMKKIRRFSSIADAEEKLSHLPRVALSSIVKDVGFGADPSNIIAVLDLLERNGESWETMMSWLIYSEGTPCQTAFSDTFYRSSVSRVIFKHSVEISSFHQHQISYDPRTQNLAPMFLYLFFRNYGDDGAVILREWIQNTVTRSFYDLVQFSDNFSKFGDYPADWIFSIIGVTKQTKKG